jgi:uncharacterized DUF497 family protein
MQIEYDPDKDEANRAKHNVGLAFGARVFEDPFVSIVPTLREEDGEERFKAVGLVERRLWTAVYVWRGDVVRFMSVRRSNGAERRDYDRDPGRPE